MHLWSYPLKAISAAVFFRVSGRAMEEFPLVIIPSFAKDAYRRIGPSCCVLCFRISVDAYGIGKPATNAYPLRYSLPYCRSHSYFSPIPSQLFGFCGDMDELNAFLREQCRMQKECSIKYFPQCNVGSSTPYMKPLQCLS